MCYICRQNGQSGDHYGQYRHLDGHSIPRTFWDYKTTNKDLQHQTKAASSLKYAH